MPAWGSQLSQSEFEAIEIAINATGQAGVASLQQNVQGLQGQINQLTAAIQAQHAPTTQQLADLAKLITELREAEAAATAATRVLNGQSAAFATAQGKIQGASQAVLEFSRGLEDFATGGFLGALNNIPRFFGGIGQAAGLAAPQVAILEAGATALATAGYTVWRNWDQVKRIFDDGLSPKMLADVKELEAALKELESREIKTAIDWSDIKRAREELAKLTAEEKVYQALKAGKTVEQSEQGKLVSQAITEQGGGIDEVIKAAAESTPTPEGEATRKLRETLAFIDDPRNRGRAGTDPANRADYAKRLADAEAADAQNHWEATKRLVTGAAGGDEAQRAWLEGLVRGNLGRFTANGATPDFMQALRGSSREAIRAREEQKAENEIAKEQADQARNAAQAQAKAEREAKQAATKEERDKRAGDKAAVDLNYHLAVEENNRINAARKEKERVAKQERDRDIAKGHRANQQREAADRRQVGELDDAYLPEMQRQIAMNRVGQLQGDPRAVPEAVLARRMQAVIGQNLRASGQDPNLAQGVVASGFKEANEKYAAAFARTGNQADAMIQVVAELQAMMGAEMQKINRRDQQVMQLQAGNRALNQQVRRAAIQRPTRMITIGP